VVRWLGVSSFVIGVLLSGYSVLVKGQPFNIQEYGIGVGALVAALGAAIKLSEDINPENKPKA
jgi:hypothetical protein